MSSNSRLEGDTANVGAPSVEDQINTIEMGRFQWLLIVIFGLITISDGMEMVVISLLYSALHHEWGLSKIEEGLLAGFIFVGFLFGNIIGGYLGDRWGRRNTLLLSGTVFLLAAAASAFSPDLISLCILRMIVGLAVGCKLPVSVSIMIEFTPSRMRGRLGLALAGIAFALGEAFVCLVGIIIHQLDDSEDWWRTLLLCCCIPDVFGIPLAFRYIPESPHFLLTQDETSGRAQHAVKRKRELRNGAQGRNEEVEELIKEVAIMNTGSTDVLLQGGRVHRVKEEGAGGEEWSLGQLFLPSLRSITLFVMTIWMVCSFAYYGHVFSYPIALQERYDMEIENQYFAVMLAGLAEIPGILAGFVLIDIEGVGRRRSLILFFLLACLSALAVPFFVDPSQFLIANMVLKTFINTPFCILYVFAAELFPTTHRASGIAFCSATSRVAGALAPVITAWSLTQSITLTYQLFAVAMGVGAAAAMSFEFETQHGKLPEFAEESYSNATRERPPEARPLMASSQL